MDRNFYIFFFFMLAVTLVACNMMEKKDKAADKAVLTQPPFKGLTDSIRAFPADALLYLQRGDMLSQKGINDLANLDYKKAWELQPEEVTALSYASSLFMINKHNEAIVFLQDCIKKYPANSDFKRRLGEAYMQVGKNDEAMKIYDEMLQADSTNFEAWYEKGSILANQKDTTHAINALEKSYTLMPVQLSGTALANLYAETKNAKAITICDELLQKDSTGDVIDAYFIKGIYYTNINSYTKAIEQFDACIKMDWKFTEAYIEKGIVFYQQKNIDEALQTFKLAITVSNTDADGYYWAGRCYEYLKKNEEATEYYFKALAFDKDFIQAKEAIERLNKKQ